MKYSILTYIFGNYEKLKDIQNPQNNVEYICVTDNNNLKSNTWKIIIDNDIINLNPIEKTYYVRYHPWKYANTDICIRIDGSIQINNSLDCFIDLFNDNNMDSAYMIHPIRNNFIDEYNAWIELRNYDLNQANKCIDFIKHTGYNFDYKGLIELCFSIQRKNKVNYDTNNLTYAIIKYLGNDTNPERIDQIILTYVIHHLIGKDNIKILPLSPTIINNTAALSLYFHNSNDKAIRNCIYYDKGYLFDNIVNLVTIHENI